MSSRMVAALIALALVTRSAGAAAAEPENITQAREIANAAADDLDAGQFASALDKVSRAEGLYHAPTHLLIMGDALSGLGRLVEALEVYERLAAEPLAATAPAAFLKARQEGNQKQRALLARVPSLLVEITGAPIEQTKALLDGHPLPLDNTTATRVNPGKHTIHVEASGFVPLDREIELQEKGGVVKITLRLEVASARLDPAPLHTPMVPDKPKANTLLVPALSAFGVGAAGLAMGVVTGVMSTNRVNDLKERCTSDWRCPPSEATLIDDAKLYGNLSTVGFVLSGAALSTGVLLLILGKPQKPKPNVEAIGGPFSLGIRGRF